MSIESHGPDATRAEESAPALDRDILDALTTLIKRAGAAGHSIAAGIGVAPPDLLAIFKLDGALAMKELAQRLGCDASFVTAIADNLERRGFARREPCQRDRRIKNLVLTPDGLAAKERLMRQLAVKMPWCYALNDEERRCLLGLLRKMLAAPAPGGSTDAGTDEQANQPLGQPPGQASTTVTTEDHRQVLADAPGTAAGHEPTGLAMSLRLPRIADRNWPR